MPVSDVCPVKGYLSHACAVEVYLPIAYTPAANDHISV